MSGTRFKATNFSTSYAEVNVASYRKAGLNSINSVAYNGNYWIIGGDESRKRLDISTYVGVMNGLKKMYEFTSKADSLQLDVTKSESTVAFLRSTSDGYKSFCDTEYELQKRLFKRETSFQAGSTHTMAISYDGRSWNLIDSNPFAYNNYIPHSTYSELVGVFPQNYAESTGIRPKCNGIAWNGSFWIAVGSTRTVATNIDSQLRYWDGMNFQVRGSELLSCIATSTDGLNWTKQPFFKIELNCVAASKDIIVVGGPQISDSTLQQPYSCLATSTDGKTWSVISSQTPISVCRGIAYNGVLWVAVGEGGISGSDNIICTSTNGIDWIGRLSRDGTTRTFRGVAWNGEKWLAVGNGILGTSTDGLNWTVTSFSTILNTVSWDGSQWIIGGNDGVFTSIDGINWSFIQETDNALITSSATTVVLPLLDTKITVVNSLLVGNGNPSSIYASNDSIIWQERTPYILRNNESTKANITIKSVIWDGTQWIIAGSFDLLDSLYKSTDAIDWTAITVSNSNINDIVYNGSLYVVVTDSIYKDVQIYTSSDASTWTARTSNFKGLCIAYNSDKWVIGGESGIQYSSNGTTWIKSSTCPLTKVNKIVWNGFLWIAVGRGPNSSIVTSIDGMRWYNIKSSSSLLFTEGRCVSWNKSIWVAFGIGTVNQNTIATSVDGYNWVGRGNSVFGNSAEFIVWNGTNFLGFGDTTLPYVTSTDGINWTNSKSPMTIISGFANKTISIPITGVSNTSLLTGVNSAVSQITALTDATIAEELAAAQLAADQAAQAVLAAQKTVSINDISLKRIHILYWEYRITTEFSPLRSSEYVDFSLDYPYDFYLCEDLVNDVQEFVKEIEPLYPKLSTSIPTEEFNNIIILISGRHSELFQRLPDYYNSCRILYTKLLDGIYDSLTLQSTSDTIENWGFSTTNKNRLIDFYNVKKNAYNTLITNAKTSINSDLTSIVMGFSTNASDYTVLGNPDGFNFTPSMFVVNNSDFVNKPITGNESFLQKSIPFDGGSVTVGILFLNLLKPSGGDILQIYESVAKFSNSISTTETYETDGSNALFYLSVRKKAFETLKPIKDKCDEYFQKSTIEGQKWLSVISETIDQFDIDTAFSSVYNKYFYNLDVNVSNFPGYLVPESYFETSQIPAKYKYAERIFQTKLDKYENISVYPEVTQNIKNTMDSKFNQVNTQRAAAETYSRNKRSTFLNEYSRGPNLWPRFASYFDIPVSEIEEYCINFNELLSDQQRSLFKRLEGTRFFLGKIIEFGETAQNMITDIKLADIEAEEDGATPPITGWGSDTTNLTGDDIGSEGVSGWNKYNETYRRREVFSNFLGTKFGFTNVALNNKNVQDFLNFLTESTPDGIISFRNQVVTEFDEYLDNNKFETEYIDQIFSNSVSAFTTHYRSRIKTKLKEYLNSSVQITLPSESDLQLYGHVMVGSLTLSQFVTTITDDISDINTEIDDEDISTYTFSQLQTFGQTVTSDIDTLSANIRNNNSEYNATLRSILNSKEFVSTINFYTVDFRKSIDRFQRAKENVLNNPPYPIGELADGYGNDFIVSVVPTNEFYWKERNATVALDPVSNGFLEAQIDSTSGQYKIVDPLNSNDYPMFSLLNRYVKYDRVSFDGKIYECIKDNTNIDSSGITGVDPNVTSRWKQIEYPYVEYLGEIIEARPENLLRLVPQEFEQYNNEDKYNEGSYVSYNSKVYYCIKDFSNTKIVKGVTPPNTKYWQPIVYPRVTYLDRFNRATVEGSPANLVPFNPDNFQVAIALKRYYNGDVVVFLNSSSQRFLYKCIATNTEGVVVDPSIAPSQTEWEQITYPSVDFNGTSVNTGTIPFPIPQLNINDISTYSNDVEYLPESLVKVENIIYVCLISTGSDIQNILPTNSIYWEEVNFPRVSYNSKVIEATPLTIPKLNVNDYDAYSPTTTYVKIDKVSFNGLIYECYYDQPIQVPIGGISFRNTTYWKERKYDILFDVYGNEFEPQPSNLGKLDELDYHLYDNNFLYYYGDLVSYNSKVYQCINVENPQITPLVVTNIDVSDTRIWKKQNISLTSFRIFKWSPTVGYTNGAIITFESNFYICEFTHLATSVNPVFNIANWTKIAVTSAIQNAKQFVLTDTYVEGDLVFTITNTETDTTADFYKCIHTTREALTEYEYAEIILNGEIDSDGYEKYDIDNKTWLSNDLPRHGTSYAVDPFSVHHFAFRLRRRVATSFELQYHHARKMYFDTQVYELRIGALGATTLPAPSNDPDIFTNLGPTIKSHLRAYESVTRFGVIRDLYLHAYKEIYEELQFIKENVISYRSAVNVMKSQYFSNPNIQTMIYKDVFPFLNYIAASLTPPKQEFKDLGVGNIDEINYELDVVRSQLKYSEASRRYYYEKQPIIDDYEEKIYELVILAKYIIGYPIAFDIYNARQTFRGRDATNTTMGGVINCDSIYPGDDGIPIPICGFDDIYYVNGESSPENIFRYIHDIMIEAMRPPEYVTDTNLASVLSWESTDPFVKGLTVVAKGAVGITAAAFESISCPMWVIDLVELAGQVARWDFETKILTFVPDLKYPNFIDAATNRMLFKIAIKKQREINAVGISDEDTEEIDRTIALLRALALLAMLDLKSIRSRTSTNKTAERVLDNSIPITPDVPIRTSVTPVAPTPSPREVLVAPTPPKTLVPGPFPNKPIPLETIATRNLQNEIISLQENITRLEIAKADALSRPRKAPIPTSIPQKAKQAAETTGVAGIKFGYDNNLFRGPGQQMRILYAPNQPGTFRFIGGTQPAETKNTTTEAENTRLRNAAQLEEVSAQQDVKRAEADIQKVKGELATRQSELNATELKNKAIESANAESMKSYKKEMEIADREFRETKLRNAQNQVQYDDALRQYNAKKEAITAQEKADLEAKRNRFIQSREQLASRELVATQKRAAFNEALLEEPGLKGFIDTKLTTSLRAKYLSAINLIVNSTVSTVISTSYRRGYVYLANTKVARVIKKVGRRLPFRGPMIGPLAEIAGIGLTAWQGGAFSSETELEEIVAGERSLSLF
jgi:hypothetical protein